MITACYVYLMPSGMPVARTVTVSDSVMVDVDAEGKPVGVEVLDGTDYQAALVMLAMAGRVRIT